MFAKFCFCDFPFLKVKKLEGQTISMVEMAKKLLEWASFHDIKKVLSNKCQIDAVAATIAKTFVGLRWLRSAFAYLKLI